MWLTVFSHRCRHCRSTSLFTFNKIYPKIHSIPRTLSELFLWMDEVSFSKKYAFLFPFFSPKSQSSCWKVDGVLFPAQGVCVCVFVCVCVWVCVCLHLCCRVTVGDAGTEQVNRLYLGKNIGH